MITVRCFRVYRYNGYDWIGTWWKPGRQKVPMMAALTTQPVLTKDQALQSVMKARHECPDAEFSVRHIVTGEFVA